jgi:hypothetical protein
MRSVHPVLALAVIVAGALAAPRTASAVEIFINGVKATGLKSQSLQNCSVRFDESGNVHITAANYKIHRVEGGGSSSATNVKRQYFLVSMFGRQGYAQYDVDVYLNGKWIRKVRNSEGQVIHEVTNLMTPGRKVVVNFAATKNLGEGKGRLSTSSSDFLRVVIGVGSAGGGTVNITSTLADFRATADKTGSFGQEASFTP